MRVVLDTNVIVSGLLSPYGASGEVVRMLVAGSFELLYDARIVSEYEDVLRRPKFSFDGANVGSLIEFIVKIGIPVTATPLKKRLRDRFDEPFLEVAISGKADCLITGNLVHFPGRPVRNLRVISPRQFINRYF